MEHPGLIASAMQRRLTPVLLLVLATAARSQAATLPPLFEDIAVMSVGYPTALAFTPDRRLLVTSQLGRLFMHSVDRGTTTLVLDLSSRVCTDHERGLLGVAVDPAFAINRQIYLYYTFAKFGECPRNNSRIPVNRVGRFTLPPSNVIDPASEVVILDNIPSTNGTHNAGDLEFGPDGYLYVAIGDGGCDYLGNSGCGGENDTTRDRNVLLGKVLRITRDGGIPPDNPFQGPGTARCGPNGLTTPGLTCQETFASGLRNPFRIAFDPNSPAPRLFISDVGQNTWEEVNLGMAGADYGWNAREGPCQRGVETDCVPAPPHLTDPIYAYPHSTGCTAITGGAFVPDGIWPAEFDGSFLFGDFVCGSIFSLTLQDGTYVASEFATGLGDLSAVDLQFGPYRQSQALYYITFSQGGQVRRIAFTDNASPTAVVKATPTFGRLPLTVTFSGLQSVDPESEPLTYRWDFGDDSAPAFGPLVGHTYVRPGAHTARLTVRDSHGNANVDTVRIDAGNTPPRPVILSPSASSGFAVDEIITLVGAAIDLEDGILPVDRLIWTVLLHHNSHIHPLLPPTIGNNVQFAAPAPEDLPAAASSFLEIILTATDSGRATSSHQMMLLPRRVQITLATQPAGLAVYLNDNIVTTPFTFTSWENHTIRLRGLTQSDAEGAMWLFNDWSDGQAADHVVAPVTSGTYTATFTQASALRARADAFVRDGTFAGDNFGREVLLQAWTSETAEARYQSYVRFDVSAFPGVGRAVLRLFGAASDARSLNVPVRVFGVADLSWSETAITWNTKPPSTGSVVAVTTVPGELPQWHEWDVTDYVRNARSLGQAAVTFVVRVPWPTWARMSFVAREGGSSGPALLIVPESDVGGDRVTQPMNNAIVH